MGARTSVEVKRQRAQVQTTDITDQDSVVIESLLQTVGESHVRSFNKRPNTQEGLHPVCWVRTPWEHASPDHMKPSLIYCHKCWSVAWRSLFYCILFFSSLRKMRKMMRFKCKRHFKVLLPELWTSSQSFFFFSASDTSIGLLTDSGGKKVHSQSALEGRTQSCDVIFLWRAAKMIECGWNLSLETLCSVL